jgi:hypothetical protein
MIRASFRKAFMSASVDPCKTIKKAMTAIMIQCKSSTETYGGIYLVEFKFMNLEGIITRNGIDFVKRTSIILQVIF